MYRSTYRRILSQLDSLNWIYIIWSSMVGLLFYPSIPSHFWGLRRLYQKAVYGSYCKSTSCHSSVILGTASKSYPYTDRGQQTGHSCLARGGGGVHSSVDVHMWSASKLPPCHCHSASLKAKHVSGGQIAYYAPPRHRRTRQPTCEGFLGRMHDTIVHCIFTK
jgi:hypothetical protein